MALSEAEVQAVYSRTPKGCILCKSEDLAVGEALIVAEEVDRNLAPMQANVYYAQAICKSCGHTLLFRAEIIGVLPRHLKNRDSVA
jgi:predicted nucleic-acid-binding Zn-ribbon protein